MKRVEDPIQIRGLGQFIDDLKFEGMLFCAFVRSPYSKAKINSIKRPADPRLLDFLDGIEVEKLTNPCDKFEMEGRKFERYALAKDQVHFVGEAVAAVLARSRYEAEDLVELVEVEYEPEESIIDSDSALSNRSKVIDSWPDNVAFQKTINVGDFKTAYETSPHKFEFEITIARQAAIPIEARGNISAYDTRRQELVIWTPVKGPHSTRSQAAACLRMKEEQVQVKVPDIGGGFGVKAYFYPEDAVTALFSKRNGHPVKWISTRTEDLLSTLQAKDQTHKVRICLDHNLKISGFSDSFVIDVGTPGFMSFSPVSRLLPLQTGCYKIPNVQIEYKGTVSNKPPTGPIRGNGRPEAILMIERAVDMAAHELKVDPAELRRRNFIHTNEMPYNNKIGANYDLGDYERALNEALASAEYQKLLVWKKEEFEKRGRLVGIGLASYVEDTGIGPSAKIGRPMYETAYVRVEKDGQVTVLSGSMPHGQGHETVFTQVVANELIVPFENIHVKFGDTQLIPYGVGSFGSRTGPVGTSAVYLAAKELKEKMTRIAANMLGSNQSDVKFASDGFSAGGKTLSFKEVASASYVPSKAIEGMDIGLSSFKAFDPPGLTYSYGAVVAVVEVDRESGRPTLVRLTIMDDCGKILDEHIVEGQIHGGVAHAVGNGLLEEIVYDKTGQPLDSNLLDYTIPTSLDVPSMNLLHMETPSQMNPLGVRGAGEGGTIGGFAAIANAICDAIGGHVSGYPPSGQEILKVLNKKN